MSDLEGQLRALAAEWSEQVPPTDLAAVEDKLESQRRLRRRSLLAVAATLVVLAGVGSLWWWNRSTATEVRTIDEGEVVEYQRIEYRQDAALSCDDPRRTPDDGADEMVFETWAAPDIGRWRQTVTYPDGTSRTLVVADDPDYPTGAWATGEARGATWACGQDILVAEPGRGSLFVVERAISRVAETPERGTDSLGRGAEIRTDRVGGVVQTNGSDERPIVQVDALYLTPGTFSVLERRFSQESPAFGSVSWIATVTTTTSLALDAELFSVEDLEPVDTGLVDESMVEATLLDPPFDLGAVTTGVADGPAEFARSAIAELTGWTDIEVTGDEGDAGPVLVELTPPPPGEQVTVLVIPAGDDAWTLVATQPPQGVQRAGPLGQVILELPDLQGLDSVDVVADSPSGQGAWTADVAPGDAVLLPGTRAPVDSLVTIARDREGQTLAVWGEVDPAAATTAPDTTRTIPDGWASYVDAAGSLSIAYPADWSFVTDDLTPGAGLSFHFALSTVDSLTGGGGGCGHLPVAALEALGPDDVFVHLEERGPVGANPAGYANRPTDFAEILDGVDSGTDAWVCTTADGSNHLGTLRWFSFADAGRAFYLLTAAGPDVSDTDIAAAADSLNSLTFEEP
ncbi:MAG: hypothetical protein AAFZ07_25305 [Actinomycetota bacterium]